MSASILDPKGITAANVAVAPTLPDIMPPVKARKGFFIGYMTHRLLMCSLGRADEDDRCARLSGGLVVWLSGCLVALVDAVGLLLPLDAAITSRTSAWTCRVN